MSGKLYNWLLYASKWILRYEKCNVKRGKRIGGSKKIWRRTDGAPLQRRRDGGRERTDTKDLGRDTQCGIN